MTEEQAHPSTGTMLSRPKPGDGDRQRNNAMVRNQYRPGKVFGHMVLGLALTLAALSAQATSIAGRDGWSYVDAMTGHTAKAAEERSMAKNGLFPVQPDPKPLTPLMRRELRGCFDFFWYEWVSDPASPTYGMTCGDYVGLDMPSPIPMESQGFYFAAIVIGVERGWISRDEGRERVLITMKTIKKLKNIRGFYYHFIDRDTGLRGWDDSHDVDLSNASTGTMIMGALIAGEYFGGEVKALADELYSKMDWKWYTNPVTKHPYLSCYPEDKPVNYEIVGEISEDGHFGGWAGYSEHIFLYILGAGAPNPECRTGADSYYAMATSKGKYKDGEEFIFCPTGAAFTYQWTHAFIDFRNMVDRLGRNWFENSRHAAIAARQYAIDKADEIKGLGPDSWGMTACMKPPGDCSDTRVEYGAAYGAEPIGPGHKLQEDGTVAPYGSSAFVVFTPKESIEALHYMYTIPGLVGKYGLYDSYNFIQCTDGDKPWIGKSYLGIDKGLVLLMFENYSTQLIWKLLHRNEHIQRGLKRLGFKYVGNGSE